MTQFTFNLIYSLKTHFYWIYDLNFMTLLYFPVLFSIKISCTTFYAITQSRLGSMLLINLLTLFFLILNLVRCFLSTYIPSGNHRDWFCSALGQLFFALPLASSTLTLWLNRAAQCLSFSCSLNLIIQCYLGFLPLIVVIAGIFIFILLLLACIDWYYLLLPNSLVLMLIALGSFTSIYYLGIQLNVLLIKCGIFYGIFWLVQAVYYVFKQTIGLGQGDVKLVSALASWYDIQQLSTVIIVASLFALPFFIFRYFNFRTVVIIIPYGTFLSLSALVCSYIFHHLLYYCFY